MQGHHPIATTMAILCPIAPFWKLSSASHTPKLCVLLLEVKSDVRPLKQHYQMGAREEGLVVDLSGTESKGDTYT